MHYFIYSSKDSYITKNSSAEVISYKDSEDKNYGGDEILELKKEFFNSYSTTPQNISRMLVQFDYTNISQSIVDEIITNPKFYLKYYEVEGQSELTKTYSLSSYALKRSWEEGLGKKYDTPSITDDVTWKNRITDSTWTTDGGDWLTGGDYQASQSFVNQSGDIEMDVTDIVNNHLDSTIPNYGFITKFSGSLENDISEPYNLKFFSKNTHTIYAPRLEVRWDDSSFSPGELNSLSMSGEFENHIFINGLKESYMESERVRFRIGCRKKYVQKTFTESVHNSSFYVPEGSGSYSIVDVATDTSIVPFSDYTKLSADLTSMYFDQNLNAFETGRYYKILFKLKYNDGQEIIYNNNEEFKIV